jgi:hypothetical protein
MLRHLLSASAPNKCPRHPISDQSRDLPRFGEPSRFEPFGVGILKGDAYPGNAGRGLVHRSPAIAGSG